MQRILLFLSAWMLTVTAIQASLAFDTNTKYRFSCKAYGSGSLVLGQNHQSSAILYYDITTQNAPDSWWYIRPDGTGYTLTNAYDGRCIVYNADRIPEVAKGLQLTDTPEGNATRWNISEHNGYLAINSVAMPDQWFNLRLDGTYLMGTYAWAGTDNELFRIFDEYGNEVGASTGNVHGHFAQAFASLQLNGKELVYDNDSQSYLMQLPTALRGGGNFTAPLTYTLKPERQGCSLQFNHQSLTAESTDITIENADCATAYPLTLTDTQGNTVAGSELRFTFLPLVEIDMPSCNGSYYTDGKIRVTNADQAGSDETYNAAYRYRGVTAQKQEKKAYNIKLRDEQGKSMDQSFFGLRSDNNWVLDAMAIDRACMRNRACTDLWNDFSAAPYYKDREPKHIPATRGRFVEVLLNGKYHGIYCMTEKIDRKQLKLKKFEETKPASGKKQTVRGLLYKSAEWSYEVLMGRNPDSDVFPGYAPRNYYNTMGVENWADYEIKYPDYEEEAVEWKPLWEAVNFVATSDQSTFEREVKERFDFPVVTDYYLFIELLLATDNHGKNMFFYVYDQTGPEGTRMGFAPWDLDGAWGGRWDGSVDLTFAQQDFDEFLWQHEHGPHTLYYKLAQSTTLNWKQTLAERYAELRHTYFTPELLGARIADYAALFAESRADVREGERWPMYHADIQYYADHARQWIADRLTWLDSKYGYDPAIEAINTAKAEDHLSVTGGYGSMAVTAGRAQTVQLHHLSGRLVRTVHLNAGLNTIDGLQAGIYLLNGHKVAVQ